MSYCRFSNSDVYMFASVNGGIECCACALQKKDITSVNFNTEEEAINHLYEHKKAGHYVPKKAITRLKKEDKIRKEVFNPFFKDKGIIKFPFKVCWKHKHPAIIKWIKRYDYYINLIELKGGIFLEKNKKNINYDKYDDLIDIDDINWIFSSYYNYEIIKMFKEKKVWIEYPSEKELIKINIINKLKKL